MTLVVGTVTGLIAVFVTFCTKALYNFKLTPVYTALHVAGGVCLVFITCMLCGMVLHQFVPIPRVSHAQLFARLGVGLVAVEKDETYVGAAPGRDGFYTSTCWGFTASGVVLHLHLNIRIRAIASCGYLTMKTKTRSYSPAAGSAAEGWSENRRHLSNKRGSVYRKGSHGCAVHG